MRLPEGGLDDFEAGDGDCLLLHGGLEDDFIVGNPQYAPRAMGGANTSGSGEGVGLAVDGGDLSDRHCPLTAMDEDLGSGNEAGDVAGHDPNPLLVSSLH